MKKFVLFSDCITVKGAKRSTICDLRNNRYYFIPNSFYDFLERYNGSTVDYIKEDLKFQYDDIVDEYIAFLKTNRLIFFTDTPECFPKMDLKWDSPALITNMIIDYEDASLEDYRLILDQLEELKCSNLQFRFFEKVSLEEIALLLEEISKAQSRVMALDFVLPYDVSMSLNEMNVLFKKHPRIHSIILFNATEDKDYQPFWESMGYLVMTQKNSLDEKHCGLVSSKYFYANIKLFSESKQFNSCLNRKISIDKKGEIRNCPSMKESFGNIKDTTLLKALGHPEFKKYWNITKDQIQTCKDCEFRHICTDCRAYIEEPENVFSKPLKCGYDPYTTSWEDVSKNPLKQKAFLHYGISK